MTTDDKKFCVYLTVYTGNKIPMFYLGFCRVSRLARGYRGSVSSALYRHVWVSELREAPHHFKTKIVRRYATAKEASSAEHRLQMQLNVVDNPLYINSACFPHFGTQAFTDEHKTKISKALIGQRKPVEAVLRNSQAQKRLYLAGYTNPFKGKTHSDETRNLIKKKRALQVISVQTREKMRQSRIAFLATPAGEKCRERISEMISRRGGRPIRRRLNFCWLK